MKRDRSSGWFGPSSHRHGGCRIGGSRFSLLVLLPEPNPVLDWMRVITIERSPTPAPDARTIAAILAVISPLAGFAVTISRWLLNRLRITEPSARIATVLLLVFVLAFVAETVRQIWGAWGDLTASDATGALFERGQLTLHGWETITRRAVFAVGAAGLVGFAFGSASVVAVRRRD